MDNNSKSSGNGTAEPTIAAKSGLLCCYFLQHACTHGTQCDFSHYDNGQPCKCGQQCRLGHATGTRGVLETKGVP